MHVFFAFSIHHFVSSVGSDAGFAAIIGLAILVLLYFAQARETSTLRDEATAASQRVEQLERHVAQLGRGGVAPPPLAAAPPPQPVVARPLTNPIAAATAGAGTAAPAPAPPTGAHRITIPAAPAGVGAPALIDATRLIPAPEPAVAAAAAGSPAVPSAAPPEPVKVPGEPIDVPGEAGPAPVPVGAGAVLATPPPATAAAAAGAPAASATVAPPAPATGTNGTGEHPASPPPATGGGKPPPRVQIRSGGAGPQGSLLLGGEPTASSARRWLPAVLGVLLLGAIVAVLLVVTSGGGTSHHAPPAAKASNAPTAPVRAVFKPSSVTVAVLNGTDVSQLAHKIGQQLTGSGYKEGALATAANQSQSTTVVGYLPGFKHDATKVATALKLSAANVQPVAQSAQTVACPPPGACHANVIVTVGSDLANG